MSRERWGRNAPAFFAASGEEFNMGQAFEVKAEPLMQSKLVTASLRVSDYVRIVLQRVKFFHSGTELLPRTFATRRQPKQQLVRLHRILLHRSFATAR